MLGGLEGSLYPASQIGECFSHDEDFFIFPRPADCFHDCLNIITWEPVVISCSKRISTPILIQSLLDPSSINLLTMKQRELPHNLPNNLHTCVDHILIALFFFQTFSTSIFLVFCWSKSVKVKLEIFPKLGCHHIIVRSQKEILIVVAEVKALTNRQICYWNSSHLLNTSERLQFWLIGVSNIPPILCKIHDDLNGRHSLSTQE